MNSVSIPHSLSRRQRSTRADREFAALRPRSQFAGTEGSCQIPDPRAGAAKKRKPIGFGVEKYETPEEIDSQLNDKNIQTATSDC